MNTRQVINDYKGPPALSVSFNAQCTHFAVGTPNGFLIYQTESCHLDKRHNIDGGIQSIDLLEDSDVMFLVGAGDKHPWDGASVQCWLDKQKQILWDVIPVGWTESEPGEKFNRWPRRVCVTWKNMLVITLYNVDIYSYKGNDPVQDGIFVKNFDSIENPTAIGCLSNTHFAHPGMTPGQVKIVEISTMKATIIPAHKQKLRAMAMSRDGQYIATASEDGRIIRIWAVSNGAFVAKFRRGMDPAKIFTLAFSPSGKMLAVTSDKSTLHIFELGGPSSSASDAADSISTAGKGKGKERRFSGDSDFASVDIATQSETPKNKWGPLADVPGLPTYFSDVTSVASARFNIGDEPRDPNYDPNEPCEPRRPDGRAEKGVVGWLRDDFLVVVGAGQDARYERFAVGTANDGKKFCKRAGWCSYLRQS